MRIAFNGQRLAGQPFGVGRYLEYLLRYWKEQLVEGEEVSLFVRQPLGERLSDLGPRIRTVLLESRLPGLPWETLRLGPAAARSRRAVLPRLFRPARLSRPPCRREPQRQRDRAQRAQLAVPPDATRACTGIAPAARMRSSCQASAPGAPWRSIMACPMSGSTSFTRAPTRPFIRSTIRHSSPQRGRGSSARTGLTFCSSERVRRGATFLCWSRPSPSCGTRADGRTGCSCSGPTMGDVPLEKLCSDLGVRGRRCSNPGRDRAPFRPRADIRRGRHLRSTLGE